MKNNRTCLICGKSYHYCPTCPDDSEKPNWYFVFCSEKCNELNNVISNYSVGNFSKEYASTLLKKIDFSLDDILLEENRKCIEEINKVSKKIESEFDGAKNETKVSLNEQNDSAKDSNSKKGKLLSGRKA